MPIDPKLRASHDEPSRAGARPSKGLRIAFRGRRWTPVVDDLELHARAARDRGDRRRIRLRQERHGAVDHAPRCRGQRPRSSGAHAARRPRPPVAVRSGDAAVCAAARSHDLPGADDQPQSGAAPSGSRSAEALRYHRGARDREREAEALRLFDRVRIPDAERRFDQLSAHVLRRHAPAGHDRHGARLPAEAADRRRADHGAGRHGAGRDPRPAAGPAAGDAAWRSCSSPTTWAWWPRSPTACW